MNAALTVSDPRGFREGVHYRLLTAEERRGRKWKAEALADTFIPYKTPAKHTYVFVQRGREWGRVTPQGILIRKGYQWNFCTCSPDWEKCASLPHDLLYQFSGTLWFPPRITRKWADDMFEDLCVTRWRMWYRVGLMLGSWAAWGRKPKDGEETRILTTPDAL